MHHPAPCRRVLALAASLAVSSAFGQTAPSASSSATGADQAVQLNEFDVSANSVQGYVASESTSGSRMATKIADLPFKVDILTGDFFKDFDLFDIAGDMDVSSVTGVDTEGNSQMRGFAGTFQLWNGFYDLGLEDPASLQQEEILKGPMAGIYGQTSPAGIMNHITRQASYENPYEDLEVLYGSFGTFRVVGHADEAIGSIGGVKIANETSFAGMDTTGLDSIDESPWAYDHQRSLQDAFKLQLNDHSVFTGEIDWYKKLENTADNTMLFDYNSAAKVYTGALAPIALARFSQGGPNERQNREITRFHFEYENRFNDHWSSRVSGYGYDRHNSEIYNGVSNEFDPSLGEVVGISTKPTRTILNEDGAAVQADTTGDYHLFGDTVESKTLFTIDWSENWRYRLGTTLPTTLTALLPTAQNPNAPSYNNVPDYPAWTIVTRNDKTRWDTDGLFLSEQLNIKNRLLLYGSLRHDQVTYNFNFGNEYSNKAPFALATAGQVQHFVDSAYSPAGGANLKLTPDGSVALYTNYSQSFESTAQVAKLGDQPLPNTRAWGWDYGIKANLLNNRLQFTLGGYYVTETGIKINETFPDGTTESVAGGSQNSKGIELDGSYQVTDGLFLRAGLGMVDARLLNEGTDTTADGLRPPNIPVSDAYVDVIYQLPGIFRGFAVFGRYNYQGVSYPETTASTAGEYELALPGYADVDGGLHYTWNQTLRGIKLTETLAFQVKNLLNADYVSANGTPEPERGYYISYEIRH